jgi:hypothetical protein
MSFNQQMIEEIVDDPAEVVAKMDRWQHLKGHDNV